MVKREEGRGERASEGAEEVVMGSSDECKKKIERKLKKAKKRKRRG